MTQLKAIALLAVMELDWQGKQYMGSHVRHSHLPEMQLRGRLVPLPPFVNEGFPLHTFTQTVSHLMQVEPDY